MNKIKQIISLAAVAGMLLTGCGNRFTVSEPPEPFDVTPPFYMVEDAETGGVVYMLGAMHIGRDGAVYPREIFAALDECDTLMTELDVQALAADKNAVSQAMEALLCESGRTARDYMGEDYAEILKTFKNEGIYNSGYDKYLPTTWTTQWSNYMAKECGYSSDTGTDGVILTYAKEHGKAIEEMETVREQYQINANASAALQMFTLKAAVGQSFEEAKAELDNLYEAWKNGDEAALKALVPAAADAPYPEALKDDYAAYYEAMYVKRQEKMAQAAIEKLKAGGKTFMMAGALHFAAQPSILENLAENGYEVITFTDKHGEAA